MRAEPPFVPDDGLELLFGDFVGREHAQRFAGRETFAFVPARCFLRHSALLK